MGIIRISSLVTCESVISKFKTAEEEYTVFTIKLSSVPGHVTKKYQSIIKIAKYKKILWTAYADNITDALLNHIALSKMAMTYSALSWNAGLMNACKPIQIIENLHQQNVYAKEHSFISLFACKSLKAAGLNPANSEMGITPQVIAIFAALFAMLLLSFKLSLND